MPELVYSGKVRDVYDIDGGMLQMVASDRCSAYDRYVCDIPGKGESLNRMSEWWFQNTTHIVPNHYLGAVGKSMFVKKCTPFKIEVVVRGYMARSKTKTSLWTFYSAGEREYCGHVFPDGLVANGKLPNNVVTPTTKGETDVPISGHTIMKNGLATPDEWNFMEATALKLFEYGQFIADKRGLILVDTKYEFGKDSSGKIVLIDELHTCDSSRYWIKDSYQERIAAGQDPEKLDKDAIRDYISSTGIDPYRDPIPEIPGEYTDRVSKVYQDMCGKFWGYPLCKFPPRRVQDELGTYLENRRENMVVILAGSTSDAPFVEKLQGFLSNAKVFNRVHYASAHKQPERVLECLREYQNGKRIVYITCAGMSNALSGFVAANCRFPVIACPVYKDSLDMMVNVQSTLQMPSNVPSMTVLSPSNAALAAVRILEF